MFRPAKIYHVTTFLRKETLKNIITPLHEAGICELKESPLNLESEYSYENVKDVEETYSRLVFIKETLDKYKEVPQPERFVKALLKKKKKERKKKKTSIKHKITLRLTNKIVEAVKKILDNIEPKVKAHLSELSEKKKKINHNKFLISNLYKLPDMNTDVFKSTENIKVYLGLIDKNNFKKIEQSIGDIAVLGLRYLEKETVLTVFTFTENSQKVEKKIHEVGFETLTIPFEKKKPLEIIKKLKQENDTFIKKIREIENSLKNLQKEYEEKNKVLIEELENCKEKVDALKHIKSSNSFSVLEAWLPASKLNDFNVLMKENVKNYYAEVEENLDAPTIYKNPSLIRPYEMLTNLYSPPKYKGFDPTPFLAVFFTLFFGFMLDDFFYGLIIAIVAFIALKKLGKNNQSTKDVCVFLLFLGISTIFWGIIFGAYFGNFFQTLGIKLPMAVDSMRQVMITLGIAIGLGALHLTIGLIAGFYDNLSKRKIKDAFHSQGVWLFFIAGGTTYFLNSANIGLSLIGIAVLMNIVFTFVSSGFVPALLSVFNFTGFLGDLFSYARLMALGVGTSGISLAVNFMTFLVAGMIPYIGIPLAIIIFIVGHLFNMLMNGLGAFIHSTRLHFLEFFTKFYFGGGRLYRPFKAKRKYTELGG